MTLFDIFKKGKYFINEYLVTANNSISETEFDSFSRYKKANGIYINGYGSISHRDIKIGIKQNGEFILRPTSLFFLINTSGDFSSIIDRVLPMNFNASGQRFSIYLESKKGTAIAVRVGVIYSNDVVENVLKLASLSKDIPGATALSNELINFDRSIGEVIGFHYTACINSGYASNVRAKLHDDSETYFNDLSFGIFSENYTTIDKKILPFHIPINRNFYLDYTNANVSTACAIFTYSYIPKNAEFIK